MAFASANAAEVFFDACVLFSFQGAFNLVLCTFIIIITVQFAVNMFFMDSDVY
ncbi:hypothetical protein B4109_0009 [Geobacillus stearothermophilus]|uniref:Uncharacterized protein n=1 Tax=Geobacillus stearothermophilus TaxID=1422 RepID=A0A150MSK6_GEOSE|nr:hypothetical protein B4109_0009 [Geobacillus stearothermophilus]